jgi:hypothetical protein
MYLEVDGRIASEWPVIRPRTTRIALLFATCERNRPWSESRSGKTVTKVRICDRFPGVSSLGALMKQLLAIFLALFFYVSPVQPQKSASQPTPQAGPEAASAELVTLTNAWTEAINANDRAKLEALMAPEFAAYGWNGELWATRSRWLDNVHLFSENTCTKSPRGSTATLQL